MFALMWINISETKLYFLVLLPAQKPTVKNFTSVSANTHIYRLVFCKKEKKKRPRDLVLTTNIWQSQSCLQSCTEQTQSSSVRLWGHFRMSTSVCWVSLKRDNRPSALLILNLTTAKPWSLCPHHHHHHQKGRALRLGRRLTEPPRHRVYNSFGLQGRQRRQTSKNTAFLRSSADWLTAG